MAEAFKPEVWVWGLFAVLFSRRLWQPAFKSARRGDAAACVFCEMLTRPFAVSFFQLLPADVVPLHYDLSITPDLKEFIFSGTVRHRSLSFCSMSTRLKPE
jgi:hypothetical protein